MSMHFGSVTTPIIESQTVKKIWPVAFHIRNSVINGKLSLQHILFSHQCNPWRWHGKGREMRGQDENTAEPQISIVPVRKEIQCSVIIWLKI